LTAVCAEMHRQSLLNFQLLSSSLQKHHFIQRRRN
jgi:hypothetical protein